MLFSNNVSINSGEKVQVKKYYFFNLKTYPQIRENAGSSFSTTCNHKNFQTQCNELD
jgi:hypothetical protein